MSKRVSAWICPRNGEQVRRRCCCSRLSCYLQQRVYRPPQAGPRYPTLTCLIVCLSQGPLVCVRVCVSPPRREGQGRQHTQIHTRGGGGGQKSRYCDVRYCQARVVSVCPIKGASLKCACCFECAETSAHIPPAEFQTAASCWHGEEENMTQRMQAAQPRKCSCLFLQGHIRWEF